MAKMDILERLDRAARGEHPDLVDIVCADAKTEIEQLRAAAAFAHNEMRNTVAPRNSFTDALDALDAALYGVNQ